MPIRNVLVGDTGGDIKHDDAALAVDVVAIAKPAELLLPSCIPHVELNLAQVLLLSLDIARSSSGALIPYRCKA